MPNAKDWTEEIDRATDAALSADLTTEQAASVGTGEFAGDAGVTGGLEMTNAQAQALGRGAIFGRSEAGVPTDGGYKTPEEVAFERTDNTGEASVEAAVELSAIENDVTNPETTVGVLSEVEEKEFAERDEDTAKNEADPKRSRIAEIEYRSQEAVAKGVEPGVNAFLHERSPELSALSELYREGRNKSLSIIGHPIGRDN